MNKVAKNIEFKLADRYISLESNIRRVYTVLSTLHLYVHKILSLVYPREINPDSKLYAQIAIIKKAKVRGRPEYRIAKAKSILLYKKESLRHSKDRS